MPCPGHYKPSQGGSQSGLEVGFVYEDREVALPVIPEDTGVPTPQDSDGDTCGAMLAPIDDGLAPALPPHSECCHLLLPAPCPRNISNWRSREGVSQDPLALALEEDMLSRFRSGMEAVPASPPRILWRDFVDRDPTDRDKDPPIPSDPTASSIFQESSSELPQEPPVLPGLPPAPTWLSASRSAPSIVSPQRPVDEPSGEPQPQVSGIQQEGNPVTLHVYSLSEWTRLSGLPIFHLGVEVFRCEYYFSRDGIALCPPGHHGGHRYREAVPLGLTSMSRREWRRALAILRLEWPQGAYERIGCNCQDFVVAVSDVLGVGGNLPAKYCRCAELDQILPSSVVSASGVFTEALRNLVPSPCSLTQREHEEAYPLGPEARRSHSDFGLCGGPCSQVQLRQSGLGVEKLICGDGSPTNRRNRVVYII